MNITLIGFMGTGKTTVGKGVAEQLGMTFVDMDDVIEAREGRKISDIFETDGEPYFRQLERHLVLELSGKNNQVIATGGGVVLNPDNIRDYTMSGIVVCLTATPEVILERVAKESHRPLLEGDERMNKILGILESRKDLYAAIPHQVDTTELSPDEVMARIITMVDG
jgi:shikimate kinase